MQQLTIYPTLVGAVPVATRTAAAVPRVPREAAEQIERLLIDAGSALEGGKKHKARALYLQANNLLEDDGGEQRVLVLVTLANLEQEDGRLDEAADYFDQALSVAPSHLMALRARAEIAKLRGESAIALVMLLNLLDNVNAQDERVELFASIAEQSLTVARAAIEQALQLEPKEPRLLRRLLAIHEASNNWEEAVNVSVQIAELIREPEARAREFVGAAKLCAERMGNTRRAVALYEAAIEDDPQVPEAFEAIESELLGMGDTDGVVAAYTRQLARLEDRQASSERRVLFGKLARAQRSSGDLNAAVQTTRRLMESAPEDAEACTMLADLYEQLGQREAAIGALERAAILAPRCADHYRKLGVLASKARATDREFLACAALVTLGEADINEQLTYTQHAPDGLQAFQGRFDASTWMALEPPEHCSHMDTIARAIEPAALGIWKRENAGKVHLEEPGRKFKEKPARSTVSAVRCFAWASQLLGIDEPAIYVKPQDSEFSVITLATQEPAIVLGRHVLTGRSLPELVFLATRHLSFMRSGWQMLQFWTDLSDLRTLFQAAVVVARPELAESLTARAEALRLALGQELDGVARARISHAVEQAIESGADLDVLFWAQSVEETVCRAALLAGGDVTSAGTVLAVAGLAPGGLSAAERAAQLLPFSVSESYAALRQRFAIAVA